MRILKVPTLFLILACGLLPSALPARASQADEMSREFTVVPSSDPLYKDILTLQKAEWSTIPASTSGASPTMTRYEMALVTARALIAVRALQRADGRWKDSASPEALLSLRALCVGLSSALARFDMNSKTAVDEIDGWIKSRGDLSSPTTSRPFKTPRVSRPSFELGDKNGEKANVTLSLSQRLRVFAAATSLARSENDPFSRNFSDDSASTLRLAGRQRETFASYGTALELSEGISLRGDVTHQPTSRSLASNLFGASSLSVSGAERTLGGGVDIAVRPGVMLKSNISRYESSGMGLAGLGNWSGTRYGTTLEMAGWQNRVALSAQLSRLVPEDSYALATTSAQLNLGVGLSRQVSLKLLYRQLFESPQTAPGNRIFAGGIDINF